MPRGRLLLPIVRRPDAPPISAQIAMALRKNSARVLELFRAWDEDGSGAVDRAEFHVAMKKMGLDVPKKDIDNLFSEWDKGGDGSLGLRELQKILSKGGMSSAATTPKDAKDGKKSPDAPPPDKTLKEVGTAVQATKKLGIAAAALSGAKK